VTCRACPSARTRAGLGRAFQLTNLFPNLTVLENVRLAVQATQEGPHRRGLNLWSIWSDHAALTERAHEILDAVSMADKQDATVASLPHGDQRKLEVALLMALESQVYMFDEPTAGMSHDEAPVILNLIRALKNDKTKTILLVEHKMDVVRELADRIIVLHNGTLVADGDPAEVIASPVVQEAYLGVPRRRRIRPTPVQQGRPHERQPSPLLTLEGRAHPHRGVPHPARRGPGRAARPAHHAAGAQRRGQDHHAAHHHGPVAGLAGQHALQRQDITRCTRRRSPA
jgi:branched-chain amino acid transport system ATP-binding protein